MKRWKTLVVTYCAIMLGIHYWIIYVSSKCPTWDDAWYLEESFRLFAALKEGPLSFIHAYINTFRFKAPLLSLTPIPLYLLFGAGEKLALLMNPIFSALTWHGTYLLGKRFYNETTALIAVITLTLIPQHYSLSRAFMVENLLTALLVYAALFLSNITEQNKKQASVFGMICGLGLLAKILFPLYLLGPLWTMRQKWTRHWVRITLWCIALAATWYGFNLAYVVGFAYSSGFGAIASHYSPDGLFGFSQLKQIIGQDISWALFFISLAAMTLSRYLVGSTKNSLSQKFFVLWLIIPVAAMLLAVNKESRYLAPALPALAILTACAIARLPSAPLKFFLVSLILVLGGRHYAASIPAFLEQDNDPPWSRLSTIETVAKYVQPRDSIAVAFEHPQFNANNLSSLAAAKGHRFHFINLGHAQTSIASARIRMKDKSARYLILVKGGLSHQGPAFLNQINEKVVQSIEKNQWKGRTLETFMIAPQTNGTLYRMDEGW